MRSLSSNLKPSVVFLALALLLGGFIRLTFVLTSSFPLNDGGLFYVMTQNLIANSFHLPLFTTYNNLQIPFAYPPFGFYLAGGLNQLFGWSLLDIFRILPAIFAILAIFGFYLLAQDLLKNDLQVGLATLVFALIPAGFDWIIMGGGITRAPGFFFFFLMAHFAFRMYEKQRWLDAILTAIFAGLTILSHPETAVHAAAVALVFFIFFGRNKSGLVKSGVVLLLILGLTSPWWVTVIYRHGLSPFLAAGGVGFTGFKWINNFLLFKLTGEYYLEVIGVFALLGLFIYLHKRQFLLPVLFLAIFLAAPRSATRFLAPVLALLASETLVALLTVLNKLPFDERSINPEDVLKSGLSKILVGYLVIVSVASCFTVINSYAENYTITQKDLAAFDWIAANTPGNSRVLLITGNQSLLDPVSEWFPAITGRTSLATIYGHEWLGGQDFKRLLLADNELQYCITQDYSCISQWASANKTQFDYLYIRNNYAEQEGRQSQYDSALAASLKAMYPGSVVYDTPLVTIFDAGKF